MAERLDTSSKTYRKYETDENSPNLNTLEKLPEILEKPIFDFLPESIVQNNEKQGGGAAFNFAFNPIINQLSEKVVELFEARIKEKNQEIDFIRQLMKEKILHYMTKIQPAKNQQIKLWYIYIND